MMKRILGVAIVLFAAAAMAACQRKSGPGTWPDPTQPPQDQYELVGQEAPIHYAIAAGGAQLGRMWAKLISVKPIRGSTVKTGESAGSACPGQCFEADILYHFDGIDNPAVKMVVEVYWSVDGVTPMGARLAGGTMFAGEQTGHYGIWAFYDGAPRYLLIHLYHGSGGTEFRDPPEEGWTRFLLDYK